MSTPPDSPPFVQQLLMQAGQAMAQGMARWAAQQQAAPEPDGGAVGRLQRDLLASYGRLWQGMLQSGESRVPGAFVSAPPGDRRFSGRAWSDSPIYDYLRQAYLLNADYLGRLVEALPLEGEQERRQVRFMVRQAVEALAPSNFAATNPEFIQKALETQGESIRRGIANLLADLEKGRISMTDESAFEVGRNLAATPGAVVFENELFQLIQYAPLTDKVAQRPLLMVPPCINKFYILDLQAHNSFVRYAVEQGNTVFMLSWRNVKAEQGHLGWDDYIERGVLEAIDQVRAICRIKQINVLGFCVGGTLLSSALAVARARGDEPAKSLTLLTTLLDFAEPGEIGCFVDEKSVAMRETSVGQGGLLPGRELASVFSSLRANELIWQYVVGNYLKGDTPPAFDLLYWNSDSTNLPGPFLVWYLRNMYLENNLRVPGRLDMCGVRADLGRVDMPAFVLATREDHIVPWHGAFASSRLLGGEVTFVLGASGHIAGVINPAAANKRSHWINPQGLEQAEPEQWLAGAEEVRGSWWPRWAKWLKAFGGRRIAARSMLGDAVHPPIEPAPGRYVKERA
ncbi:class I poly(R)-hydroxyalkanoic acid synthase [Denitratisoma oestradiolicum]|uniref:Poly(3-hydroxyalkanoate) polymerase subunit PhaC n=1 Tax=Denitratisoma oestradiolicum TaxID=311182 RepID=A0A6S6XXC5_9PROT|nr:class I poly(R)-hydroxyalkanoic acid synthase [Denitratisoma oestradiolicum]CAB1368757.1 Poly(3-hydroxyalkanoate) polymerase subunit PhaC [Denitratisoma oestradiolicum]